MKQRKLLKNCKQDAVKREVSSFAAGLSGLLALRGLGKKIWKGVNVAKYVKKLRDEWQE